MSKRIHCPFCLEQINVIDLKLSCASCKKDIPHKATLWEKWGILSPPKRLECPDCHQTSSSRRCPKCNQELPYSIDELPDLSIAIVGAQDSGKSHYIAMLIKQLREQSEYFSLRALNDETSDRYEHQFYNPLFIKRTVIDKTQSGQAQKSVTRPLLYLLKCKRKRKNILLAFFDSAGEDLENGDRMELVNRYICSASGIICLLDPLQLEAVRRTLSNCILDKDLPEKNKNIKDLELNKLIVDNVTKLIRNDRYYSGRNYSDDIDIPLAVTLSKTDALISETNYPLLFDHSSPLYMDGLHKGALSKSDFTRINSLIYDWIKTADENVIKAAGNYKSVGFFGFSALGTQAQHNGNARTLTCTPRPCRVLDPFMWILWKNGLIPSIK